METRPTGRPGFSPREARIGEAKMAALIELNTLLEKSTDFDDFKKRVKNLVAPKAT